MKKLFSAIRANDIDTVRSIIENKPGLVNCVAKQPPKKDDGQSPLQVALKCGANEIAMYLLDMGADVNYMEADDCCNEWRMPVIQCAIQSAVMQTRWNTCDGIFGLKVFNTKDAADKSYAVLERILDMGADINMTDSYGNTALDRAILDAEQILPGINSDGTPGRERLLTKKLSKDISRIFELLKKHGAAKTRFSPDGSSAVWKFM